MICTGVDYRVVVVVVERGGGKEGGGGGVPGMQMEGRSLGL